MPKTLVEADRISGGGGSMSRSPLFLRGALVVILGVSLGGCSRSPAAAESTAKPGATAAATGEPPPDQPNVVIDLQADKEINRQALGTLHGFKVSTPWNREWRAESSPNGGGETIEVTGPGGELRLEVYRDNVYLIEFRYRLGADGEPTERASHMGRQVLNGVLPLHGYRDELAAFKRIATLGAALDKARVAEDPERTGPSYWFLVEGWPSIRASADGSRGVMQFAHHNFSAIHFPTTDE